MFFGNRPHSSWQAANHTGFSTALCSVAGGCERLPATACTRGAHLAQLFDTVTRVQLEAPFFKSELTDAAKNAESGVTA